jgi:putative ABC transport system permease protein
MNSITLLVSQFLIAWRNVLRHKRHTLLSFVAIVFGITGLQVTLGFTDWGLKNLRETFIQTQYGHVRLTAKGYLEQGQVPVGKFLLPETVPELDDLTGDPRVKAVMPRISLSGLISHGDITVSFLGEGVDPGREAAAGMAFEVTNGEGLEAQSGVLLGEGLARYLRVAVGNSVTLVATTRTGGVSAIELPVVGVFSTGNRAYDDITLRIPLDKAKKLLRVQGVHSFLIMLKDTDETDGFIDYLIGKIDKYEVIHWKRDADYYKKMSDLYDKQTLVIKIIISIIIILGISNTLSMSVAERTAEIGTMLAMGADRWRILRLFFFEGLSLAIIGGLIGIFFSALVSWLMSNVGLQIPPPPGMTRPWDIKININFIVFKDTLLVALPSVLLASIYPAWRAANMQVVEALRKAR